VSNPLDGSALPLGWGLPFGGLLLSIAIGPLVAPRFWHAHYGKVAFCWALALLAPFAAVYGSPQMLHLVADAILRDYVPFLAILFSLFTIAGGICVRGALARTPLTNTGLLALGTALASLMGTTGASMLLIRPLLSANASRRYRVHAIVFFILLVGNVGGALSPLGDPPLFIGFLKGVDFFWTTRTLALPTLLVAGVLLAVFFVLDSVLYGREPAPPPALRGGHGISVEGLQNFALLGGVVAVALMSGLWTPGVEFEVAGVKRPLQAVVRDVAFVLLGIASIAITPGGVRAHNQFHWGPIIEVAKIFAAIFIAIFPVLAILEAGRGGALSGLIEIVGDGAGNPRNAVVYWMTGFLSALLDNAPTYLVFFNLAGGDAEHLMGPGAQTLAAISMGSVYFGALTYIGNAPNFMIKAIAEDRGVAMPSFFTYSGYALAAVLPPLALVSLIWL